MFLIFGSIKIKNEMQSNLILSEKFYLALFSDTMQLRSERLVFTKFNFSHLPDYIRLVTQDKVMKHITGSGLSAEDARKRFQVALDADQNRQDMGFLAVNEKETGEFIGLGKIVPFENGMTEIGYALLPEFWGKGYASEITRRIVEYARELGTITELIGIVDPDNQSSVRVLTRQNFVLYQSIVNDKDLSREDYVLKL